VVSVYGKMMEFFASVVADESFRSNCFPIVRDKIFLAHAAVTVLPNPVAEAISNYVHKSAREFPDFTESLRIIRETRESAARLLHASPEEIALLGPTSLGLSLFANGIPWEAGDEVVCYLDDYPANVYPWLNLRHRGVTVRYLEPAGLGEITVEIVERALTNRTRLVALASCNFISGYRIDLAAIGAMLHARGILFSVDAIQTLGAFPTTVEQVDFLSADSHKWLLGPLASGVVYVKKEHFDLCRPTLLGSWNIRAPGFVAQDRIEFLDTAQRYEPGAMNLLGIVGMKTAIDLLLEAGIDRIGDRILALRARLIEGMVPAGYRLLGAPGSAAGSGIVTFSHPTRDLNEVFQRLTQARVFCSQRQDRPGNHYIRFSPHFYNSEAEIDRVLEIATR
jgi:cysteine desulfurase/selenocysteine lyase